MCGHFCLITFFTLKTIWWDDKNWRNTLFCIGGGESKLPFRPTFRLEIYIYWWTEYYVRKKSVEAGLESVSKLNWIHWRFSRESAGIEFRRNGNGERRLDLFVTSEHLNTLQNNIIFTQWFMFVFHDASLFFSGNFAARRVHVRRKFRCRYFGELNSHPLAFHDKIYCNKTWKSCRTITQVWSVYVSWNIWFWAYLVHTPWIFI